MGYQTAIGIAESDATLEQKLSWHFSSNCYPPVPALMIPFAVEAINLANCGEWNAVIECPEGVSYRGETEVRILDVIDGLFLEAFVSGEEA